MKKTDVALAKMLVDYAASRKLYGKHIQNEIDELKKRQKDLEIEYSKIEVELKSKL
ncbi:MEI1 protein, partial [Trifolium medium]|nr:MEI1 protein [Trifolium medium]